MSGHRRGRLACAWPDRFSGDDGRRGFWST